MGRQTFTILVLFHSTITTGKECVPKIVLVSFKLLNDLLFIPFAVNLKLIRTICGTHSFPVEGPVTYSSAHKDNFGTHSFSVKTLVT